VRPAYARAGDSLHGQATSFTENHLGPPLHLVERGARVRPLERVASSVHGPTRQGSGPLASPLRTAGETSRNAESFQLPYVRNTSMSYQRARPTSKLLRAGLDVRGARAAQAAVRQRIFHHFFSPGEDFVRAPGLARRQNVRRRSRMHQDTTTLVSPRSLHDVVGGQPVTLSLEQLEAELRSSANLGGDGSHLARTKARPRSHVPARREPGEAGLENVRKNAGVAMWRARHPGPV
jgi:hypothetical protein